MPVDVKLELSKLQKKCSEVVKSLKDKKEKFNRHHLTTKTALADFKDAAKRLEQKIITVAGVKSIQDIALPETTASSTITPVHISPAFYISFENIHYLYTQYDALCHLYTTDKPDALSDEIAKSRKLITTGFSVLNKLREDDREHERNWARNMGGLVEGIAEVEKPRSFVFDDPPESIIDYTERFLVLIDRLISQYELAEDLCQKDASLLSKAYKNFDPIDVFTDWLRAIEGLLNDNLHQFILKTVLEVNIDDFYKAALEICKNPHSKKPGFLLDRTQACFEYESIRTQKITSIANTYFPSQNSVKYNNVKLDEQILEKQQEYKQNIELFAKKIKFCTLLSKKYLASKESEHAQSKLLFSELSLGVYKKCLQKYTLADAICSQLFYTPAEVSINDEFDMLMKTLQQAPYEIEMLQILEETLEKLAAQEATAPFTMPAKLGNVNMAWQKLGVFALSVIRPLEEALKKLKGQAISLEIPASLLNTPASSRPVSVMSDNFHLTPSTKRTSLRPGPIATHNLPAPSPLLSASSRLSVIMTSPASPHLAGLRNSIISDEKESLESSTASSSSPHPSAAKLPIETATLITPK